MRIETFLYFLYHHIDLYIISVLLSILLYLPIGIRIVKSIIDPMLNALVGTIFASSIPIFLFFTSKISIINFSYFLLSEIVFWGSYFLFRNSKGTQLAKIRINDSKISKSLFSVFFILMIVCNSITYYLQGIPLLLNSRLETYVSGGGIGILAHIIDFSTFYCSIYAIYLLYNNAKIKGFMTIIVIAIFAILSGSKSSILGLVSAFFIYRYFYEHKYISWKKILKYAPFILLFPLLTISIQNGGNIFNSLMDLVVRFACYGDGYFMAYPYDDINQLKIGNPTTHLFSGLLGPLRIIDYKNMDNAIGLQLATIIYPDLTSITGPNSRIPILSWVLFGWGGLILSSIFGLTFAWITTRLCHKFPSSIIPVIVYGYIYCKSIAIVTDPVLAIGRIFPFLIFISLLWILFILLNKSKIKLFSITYD